MNSWPNTDQIEPGRLRPVLPALRGLGFGLTAIGRGPGWHRGLGADKQTIWL